MQRDLGRRLRSGHRGEMRAESTGPGGPGPEAGGMGAAQTGQDGASTTTGAGGVSLSQVGVPGHHAGHRWVSLDTMPVTGGCPWAP